MFLGTKVPSKLGFRLKYYYFYYYYFVPAYFTTFEYQYSWKKCQRSQFTINRCHDETWY